MKNHSTLLGGFSYNIIFILPLLTLLLRVDTLFLGLKHETFRGFRAKIYD